MARGMLSSAEMDVLKKNPYVADVSRQRILYTYEFKCFFMEQYLAGKRPVDIFRQAGFDVPMLGEKRIERATARWRAMYAANGMEALKGAVKANVKKKAVARTKTMKTQVADEAGNGGCNKECDKHAQQDVAAKLEELLADFELYESRVRQLEKVTMELTDRMKLLEKRANELLVEKEVLRKVSRASRMDKASRPRNAVLYQFIREAVEACPEYANVKRLCEALNISASGYYAYCKS
ncbi:HTH domain-containing protein [Anaerovibrio slackiae]|uniref:HTH domain-containing protein n=1 Tax=Anaerovibrio slackiae TaxID=2652309 RepID=UPI0038662290